MNLLTKATGWLLVLVLLFATSLWRQPSDLPMLDTDVLNLLPKNQQDPLAQKAFQQAAENIEDQVVILVGHASPSVAIEATKTLASQLTHLPLFDSVTAEISDDEQNSWGTVFAPVKAQLLTTEQYQRLTDSPAAQTAYVIQSIYNPFSGVTGAELAHDPFLLFRDVLLHLGAQNSRFTLKYNVLTTLFEGKTYTLLRANLSGSAYSVPIQEQLIDFYQAEAQLKTQYGVDVLHTGAVFYAAFGAESARSEISTIGIGSMVGILLLVLFVYRSLLPVNLALLSIGSGVITAFSVSLLVFGQIHLFSLVIGASLIGVSIDYSFHFLTERMAMGDKWNANAGWRAVAVPITFGLASTLIAYLSMFAAPFPGLQQLAVFSAAGLIGAYLSVMCWYPLLAAKPAKKRTLPWQRAAAWCLAPWQNASWQRGAVCVALGIGALGLGYADYDDNIQQLQSLPPSLKQQEQRIQDIAGLGSSQPMLLVRGNSEQAVLTSLYALTPSLDALKAFGDISGYQTLADYVPPLSIQKDNYQRVEALYASQAEKLATQLGLAEVPTLKQVFTPFILRDFLQSPSGREFQPLWLGDIDDQFAALVLLQDVSSPTNVKAALAHHSHVSWLNKAEEVSRLFGDYRQRISVLIGLSCIVILIVLSLRFGVKSACRILIAPVLAAGVGLAAGALSSVPMNLFNLLALFLVMGIGIDYALFFAEQKDSLRAWVANTLAALTTLLAFGLLSLSNTEAIHSFGITVLVGISAAWLLSPIAIRANNKVIAK
ncbi:MMPL family transporter [Enterovibrio norvegicus]|uniref:MMPL family transporter n=1 Tax=Enterovibrio norvegicus TaxID=188144 RepID=UPI00355060B4